MSWFKRPFHRHPQELRVPQVHCLNEKNGPPERLLKDRLIEFFQRDKSVHRAYLAEVIVGDQGGVALCLKTEFGAGRGLAEKIGVIFGMVFNSHEHLDIMCLSKEQESELAKVCSPFFGNSTP